MVFNVVLDWPKCGECHANIFVTSCFWGNSGKLSSLFICFLIYGRSIGPRTLVWSEKEFVDQSAFEFSEVGKKIPTISLLQLLSAVLLPLCYFVTSACYFNLKCSLLHLETTVHSPTILNFSVWHSFTSNVDQMTKINGTLSFIWCLWFIYLSQEMQSPTLHLVSVLCSYMEFVYIMRQNV